MPRESQARLRTPHWGLLWVNAARLAGPTRSGWGARATPPPVAAETRVLALAPFPAGGGRAAGGGTQPPRESSPLSTHRVLGRQPSAVLRVQDDAKYDACWSRRAGVRGFLVG